MAEWISVKDRLPEVETEVLIRAQWRCGNDTHSTIATAFYEDGTVLEDNSRWNWSEIWEWGIYDEEKDGYKIPQGWWESSHYIHDDHYNNVDDEVTHWMPLPRLPEEEEADDVPTADVAPVVRGHWLTWEEKFPDRATGKNLGVFCSVCGNHADFSSSYCPHCGARMDEEDEQ